MRQVPSYTIIGDGCMARHIQHYFSLLDVPFNKWSRSHNSLQDLEILLKQTSYVLLLIKDSAIADFCNAHLVSFSHKLTIIHFSGSIAINNAYGVHPLQTFVKDRFYSLEEYKKIPFVIDNKSLNFKKVFPNLSNPFYCINAQDKAYYHAICVIANNISVILWQKFFSEMQHRFKISKKDLMPFLECTMQNLLANPEASQSGPIVRGDKETLNRDLLAMQGDSFYEVLEVVINIYKEQL